MFKEYSNFNKDLEELQRKIVVIDKFTDHTPVDKYTAEEIELIDRETERRRQEWFAKLRLARCRKTDAWGHATGEDVYEYTTQEEYDYYLREALSVSPEERYQHRKDAYYFHESHYYMRGQGGYDGQGCTAQQCIPECRYFPETGRIEDSEVIEGFEKHEKPKIISYNVDNKGQIIYHYPEQIKREPT
jgi:hypothetical protein